MPGFRKFARYAKSAVNPGCKNFCFIFCYHPPWGARNFFFSENIRPSFYFSLCQHPSQSIRSIRNFMRSVPKFGKNTRNFFSVNFFFFFGLGLDSARGNPYLQYLSRKIPTWMKYTLFLFSDFNESQLIYAYKHDAY